MKSEELAGGSPHVYAGPRKMHNQLIFSHFKLKSVSVFVGNDSSALKGADLAIKNMRF